MPVIAVVLAAAAFERAQSLVDQGLYSSLEQFMEIAALNQFALEDGVRPADIIARGHRSGSDAKRSSRDVPAKASAPPREARSRRRVAAHRTARADRPVSESELSETLRRLRQLGGEDVGPVGATATIRPQTERLWGQVNRLFPLKLACRWLLVANSRESAWARIEAIGDQLSADAATLGSALEAVDSGAGRKRDEQLATGLPRRGNIASRDRFLSQYIARTTRSSEIYPGAVCQYSLAAFDGDRLVLTDRGVELARLKNPILDEDLRRAATTLSDDERAFFTHQVLQYVPGELHDVSTVLSAVLGGVINPDGLVLAVQAVLPSEWSEVMARTHVSGIVARLSDMGLLRRHWEGRHVTYGVSAMASTFLARREA